MAKTKIDVDVPNPLWGVGVGVFWFVWSSNGFWWGVLYGLFWPVWAGYRLADYLL